MHNCLTIKEMICCFSGHRPQKLEWGENERHEKCLQIKELLRKAVCELIVNGCNHFICGMAQGGDMYFAECILSLKDSYEGIILEAAVPCRNQEKSWNDSSKKRYCDILAKCDIVTYVSEHYSTYCMHKRNRYMVDKSKTLLCMLNEHDLKSGTKFTYKYAKEKGLSVINLFENSTQLAL